MALELGRLGQMFRQANPYAQSDSSAAAQEHHSSIDVEMISVVDQSR